MTPEQFAYWFQGFAELSPTPPTQEQWDSMRAHVATVFVKVTPEVNEQNTQNDQSRTRLLDMEEAIRRARLDKSPAPPNFIWPNGQVRITC